MKKKLTYTSLLLLLTISFCYAQGDAGAPRRTPAEQVAFEKSVPLNSPKAGTLADTKTDPVLNVPQAVANSKPAAVDNNRAPAVNNEVNGNTEPGQPVVAGSARSQPDGEKPTGKTVNRKDLKGTRTQPEAQTSGSVTSRKTLSGPRTQPAGEKPKR
jgi:hypothetical protein